MAFSEVSGALIPLQKDSKKKSSAAIFKMAGIFFKNCVKGFKNEVLPRLFLLLIFPQAPSCSAADAVFLEDLLEMSQIWPSIFIHVLI